MDNHKYVTDAPEFVKVFEGGRTFILVSYRGCLAPTSSASFGYGIAILDTDNRKVVLDDHFHNARENLKADEFERIKAMDWEEFSAFVRNNPRYPGRIEDIDAGGPPAAANLINQGIALGKPLPGTGPSILPADIAELDADPATDVRFDHKTREEMIVFLALHQSYHPGRPIDGGYCIAWNIKAQGGVDMTGKDYGNNPVNSNFDEMWSDYIKSDKLSLYDKACKGTLRTFTDGDFTSLRDNDRGSYKFDINGRSDDYLILEEFEGLLPPGCGPEWCKMVFSSKNGYIEWLKDMSEEDLVSLYVVVTSVDLATKNPHEAISHQLGLQRGIMEEKWKMEMAARKRQEAEKAARKPSSTMFP